MKKLVALAILFAWGCSDDSLEVVNIDSGESSTVVKNNEGYNCLLYTSDAADE